MKSIIESVKSSQPESTCLLRHKYKQIYIDGLVKDCCISSVLAVMR